ncbi:hypothetical protein BC832DRAFT_590291 [Gaertneriomyces semiglobifer]|nr:hypothetical protein BC832DRAFT_590291 [Gaertneriomyces semiglobifer]
MRLRPLFASLLPKRTFASVSLVESAPVPVGALPSLDQIQQSLPNAVAAKIQGYPALVTIGIQPTECDFYFFRFLYLPGVQSLLRPFDSSYARYFETGRMAYFDQIISPHLSPSAYADFIQARAIGPILKSVSMSFPTTSPPVTYPDTITIATRVPKAKLKSDRFTQETIIVSHKTGDIVLEAEGEIVSFDYRVGKKADLPEDVVAAWETGDGGKAKH